MNEAETEQKSSSLPLDADGKIDPQELLQSGGSVTYSRGTDGTTYIRVEPGPDRALHVLLVVSVVCIAILLGALVFVLSRRR